MSHTPPKQIGATMVHVVSEALLVRGEQWVTLTAEDDHDLRIWEFSLTSGRLLETTLPEALAAEGRE